MAKSRARGEPGTLVLVAGPDARGKDMAVASVKRRFAGHPGIEFPLRVTTRPARESCEDLSVSRRVFLDMQREGAFALSWQAHGYDAAAPVAILDQLRAGHMVILVASQDAVARARYVWERVRVVELLAGPDGSRPFRAARSRLAPEHGSGLVQRIWHGGDIAEAVRRLSTHIEALAGAAQPKAAPVSAGPHPASALPQRKRAPLEWRSPEGRM